MDYDVNRNTNSVTECEQVDGVKLLDRFSNRKAATGTLYLTATHLIFVDPEGKKETWVTNVVLIALTVLRVRGQFA